MAFRLRHRSCQVDKGKAKPWRHVECGGSDSCYPLMHGAATIKSGFRKILVYVYRFWNKCSSRCFDSDPALSNDFGRCLSQEPRRLCTSTPQYRVCRTWCVYIWQSLAKAVGASARGCKSSLALEEQQLLKPQPLLASPFMGLVDTVSLLRKLTCPLKKGSGWKTSNLLKWPLFRGHFVSFFGVVKFHLFEPGVHDRRGALCAATHCGTGGCGTRAAIGCCGIQFHGARQFLSPK